MFQLGPMSPHYDQLDDCSRSLFDRWRTAAETEGRPATPVRVIDPEGVTARFRPPDPLLDKRVSGLVQLRMTVSAEGHAHDCVVQVSTGSPQFGEKACHAYTQYARFEPARDAAGTPVPALFRQSLILMIYHW
jgi:TonB family protein